MNYTKLHDRALEADMAILLTERRKALREKQGCNRKDPEWSQRQVAERAGVSAVAICHWESGYQFPGTWAQWERWARALGAKFVYPRVEL